MVTDQILDLLENGTKPWAASWESNRSAFQLPRRFCGEYYKGINVILLWVAAENHGFTSPTYMTFKQALELGGNIKKGSKGFKVVFSKSAGASDDNETDEQLEKNVRWFTRTYTVFNLEQIENLPETYNPPEPRPAIIGTNEISERAPELDAFFLATGANVQLGDNPSYSNKGDYISMPGFEKFTRPTAYYSTLAHEVIHWVGNGKRLDRDQSGKFGGTDYAKEELVAELGAAFLGARLGFFVEEREDHASYLKHWLGKMKNDKRYFMTAASQAQKAVDYIIALTEKAQNTKHYKVAA